VVIAKKRACKNGGGVFWGVNIEHQSPQGARMFARHGQCTILMARGGGWFERSFGFNMPKIGI